MTKPLVYFNGVHFSKGGYSRQPMNWEDFVSSLRFSRIQKERIYRSGIEPDWRDPVKAGWGVIFHEEESCLIKQALEPLLQKRSKTVAPHFREMIYKQGESKNGFLGRYGVGPGPVEPTRVPYYLLIVGPPTRIPFSIQYMLSTRYAVGRLCLDTPEEYAQYAQNICSLEEDDTRGPKRMAFFGVENPDDPLTEMSNQWLMNPLSRILDEKKPEDWQIDTFIGKNADKSQLQRLLGGSQSPALLFTTSHGIQLREPPHLQKQIQGSIICSDWPGPAWQGQLQRAHYFSHLDVGEQGDLRGMISFHFGCYTGGTPRYDSFFKDPREQEADHGDAAEPPENPLLAEEPFVARLPQRLLARKKGLSAVVAHVDQAFPHSFFWDETLNQTLVFQQLFLELMKGSPVGFAMKVISRRCSDIEMELMTGQEMDPGWVSSPDEKAKLWIGYQDAKNYVILGDPLARVS